MAQHYAFMVVFLQISELWIRYEYYLGRRRFLMRVLFVVRPKLFLNFSLHRNWFLHTSDLMWSDPDEVDNWAVSPRGAGWLFGGSVTKEVRRCSQFCCAFLNHQTHLVQLRQLTHPHCKGTSTRSRGIQIHVRRTACHGVVCPQLLLPVWEYGVNIDDHSWHVLPFLNFSVY